LGFSFFVLNREGAQDAKGTGFFLIGVADQENVRRCAEDFFLAFPSIPQGRLCVFAVLLPLVVARSFTPQAYLIGAFGFKDLFAELLALHETQTAE
jgi:hypothetical protein